MKKLPLRKRLRKSYISSLLSGGGSAAVSLGVWRNPYVTAAGTATLVSHELGHVLVARAYNAQPMPPIFIPLGIVTLGATRIKGMPKNGKQRIGIYQAGPIAGLGTCLMLLIPLLNTPWLTLGLLFAASECYSLLLGSDAKRARKARSNG